MVRVIVDSTCDMPAEWKAHYGIECLPLVVTLEGKSFRDKEELQIGELYGAMKRGVVPKTSQAPAERMFELFTRCCEAEEDFIYLAFSSAMSGTYQLAVMVLKEIKARYPERKAAVVDSKSGSLAVGLIAARVCEELKNGISFEEAVFEAERLVERVEHLFTLSGLDWLVRGGRINRPLGSVGDVLDLKPILDVKGGAMNVVRMVRGRKNALTRLIREIAFRARQYPNQTIGLAHAEDPDTVKEMERQLKEIMPDCKTVICEIGCVLGAHLGIGGVGAFFFNRK